MDVDALFESWRDDPPVPALIRAYLMGERKKPKKKTKPTKDEILSLAKQFGGKRR